MKNEYELISHPRIKHLNIFVVRLRYRSPHYHNEIELGLVLDGSLTMKKNGQQTVFLRNEIFLLNTGEVHELFCGEKEVTVLSIQLSAKLFSTFYPQIKAVQFLSQKPFSDSASAMDLSSMLRTLATCYFRQDPLYEFECMTGATTIMHYLLTHIPSKIMSEAEQETLSFKVDRLKRILAYIEENYQRKLLLQEIADHEELSLTYLSHFLKEMLGISFQEYLNHIRLEHAVYLLDTSEQNVLDISMSSGFSDIRYLNQLFCEKYGCTPRQYRKLTQKSVPKDKLTSSLQRIYTPEESLVLL